MSYPGKKCLIRSPWCARSLEEAGAADLGGSADSKWMTTQEFAERAGSSLTVILIILIIQVIIQLAFQDYLQVF